MRTVDRGDGWVVIDTATTRTDGQHPIVFRPGPKRLRIKLDGFNEPRSFLCRKETDDAWTDIHTCDLFIRRMEAACSTT